MASHSQHEQQNEKSADEHKGGLEVIPTTAAAEDEADTVPTASALILTASSGTSDEK